MISSINVLIEVGCLALTTYYLRNSETAFSKFTIGYLVVVCIAEISGITWTTIMGKSNAWIFNIFILFEAAYISFGMYVALKEFSKHMKIFCLATYIIFLMTYLIELQMHGFYKFNSIAILVASILFALLSLFYFYLLIKERRPIDLRYSGNFWWVSGVYVYYFGGTIYNLFIQSSVRSTLILTYIMIFLNLLLYSIWTYSFICNSRQQK